MKKIVHTRVLKDCDIFQMSITFFNRVCHETRTIFCETRIFPIYHTLYTELKSGNKQQVVKKKKRTNLFFPFVENISNYFWTKIILKEVLTVQKHNTKEKEETERGGGDREREL